MTSQELINIKKNHRVKTNGPFIQPGVPVQARFYNRGRLYLVEAIRERFK